MTDTEEKAGKRGQDTQELSGEQTKQENTGSFQIIPT